LRQLKKKRLTGWLFCGTRNRSNATLLLARGLLWGSIYFVSGWWKETQAKTDHFFVCKFITDTLLRHIGKIDLFDEGRLADGEKK
jgi:hypothetical protein